MVGTARSELISTEDLQDGDLVSVDREVFQVVGFDPLEEGVSVILAPAYGQSWHLAVHENDMGAPMWERA